MSQAPGHAATELPVPPNFPVAWRNEEERALLWRWDDIHSPLPSSTIFDSVSEVTSEVGAARAAEELRRHGKDLNRKFNGYAYSASVPETISADQEQAQRAAMEAAIANARPRWNTEFLPALERDHEHMRRVDLPTATDEQLARHLDDYLEKSRDHWYFHFLVIFPLSAAVERMADLYRDIMGQVPDEEPYALFQGMDNKTLETDRALQALATRARSLPDVARVFRPEAGHAQIAERLGAFNQGREFLSEIDRFLDTYGYRPVGFDLMYPSWIEEPSFVLLNVKSYLSGPPRDLEAERKGAATEARSRLESVLTQAGPNPTRRDEFMRAYQAARELWPLKEDHAFYIDQASTALLRMLIVEIGRRLARRSVIADSEDVFFLTVEEMHAALRSSEPALLAGEAQARRRERERFSRIIPPSLLGRLPPGGGDTTAPEFERMLGPLGGPRPAEHPTVLRGIAGSRGVVTAPAVVLRSPEEFHRVRPGDVLVCTSTSPTWTPLFGSLAALVTDSGGVLSHAAIVAREYRLPAVVGVKYGTTFVADGQLVTVDGDNGVLHLH